MQLLDLPIELIIHALTFVPGRDLGKCSQLNRFFYSMIRESSTLQYHEELSLSRTEDNPNCGFSNSGKLQLLKEREHSWITCRPDFTKSAPINFSPGSVYDLSAGVYILGDATRDRLKYLKLPTKPEDPVEWLSFEPRVDSREQRSIVDFAINLYEHDLIALITSHGLVQGSEISIMVELSIHQFSTGAYHPLAKQPVVPVIRSEIQWGTPSINCEIVGDHMALVTTFWRNPHSRCIVDVYQWKTGKVLLHIDGEPDSYGGIIFLTENLILLPNTSANTLEIWKIPSPTEDPPDAPIRILGLPELAPGRMLRYISCRSEPNPTASGATLKSDKPFHPSPRDSVVLLHLRIHHGQMDITLITVFVHRSSLLDLVEMDDEERNARLAMGEDGMKIPVPWLAWAPPVTYCIDCGGDLPSRWITTTCGQRFVMLPTDERELDVLGLRNPAPLAVYDFGRGNVEKVQARLDQMSSEEKENYTGPIVRRGATLPDESAHLFADRINSYLPFVESRTKQLYDFDGALMDDERIIGIKTDIIGHITSVEIFHFG